MKRFLIACLLGVSAVGAISAAETPNTLTSKERAEGWKLLFDGRTLQGWHGYLSETIPDGWTVADGVIALAGKEGGDIVTLNEYENFDFKFEWKISPKGNSGVLYLINESPELERTYYSGPEYQVEEAHRYYGLPAAFAPGSAETLASAVVECGHAVIGQD